MYITYMIILVAFSSILLELVKDGSGRSGQAGEPPKLEDTDEIQCEVRIPGTEYNETLVRRLDNDEARAGCQKRDLANYVVAYFVVVSLLLQISFK